MKPTKTTKPARTTKTKPAPAGGEWIVTLVRKVTAVLTADVRVPDDGKPRDAVNLAKLAEAAGVEWEATDVNDVGEAEIQGEGWNEIDDMSHLPLLECNAPKRRKIR